MADDLTELARLRERVAENQHEIWAHWMKYQFSCCTENPDGSMTIPAEKVKRWKRQMTTPYIALTEKEKESDRHQADKVIAVVDMATGEYLEKLADERPFVPSGPMLGGGGAV